MKKAKVINPIGHTEKNVMWYQNPTIAMLMLQKTKITKQYDY